MVAGSYRPWRNAYRIAHTQLVTWISQRPVVDQDAYQLVSQEPSRASRTTATPTTRWSQGAPKRFLPSDNPVDGPVTNESLRRTGRPARHPIVPGPASFLFPVPGGRVAAGGLDIAPTIDVVPRGLRCPPRDNRACLRKPMIRWGEDLDAEERTGRIMRCRRNVGGEMDVPGRMIPSSRPTPSRGLPRGNGRSSLTARETGLPLGRDGRDGGPREADRAVTRPSRARLLPCRARRPPRLLGAGVGKARTQLLRAAGVRAVAPRGASCGTGRRSGGGFCVRETARRRAALVPVAVPSGRAT
jgi:hypothetical protein